MNVEVLSHPEELARVAAAAIARGLRDAMERHKGAAIALAGGGTPRTVYELLATDELSSHIRWDRVHVFWGDERCVPPHMPESNYRMAREALLSKIPLPEKNVHRIPAERPPDEAALACENDLKNLFALKEGEFPEFDIVLLGLGEDGHTASLFPGTTALEERTRLAVATRVQASIADRITLTLPVFNSSLQVFFLVSGRSKAAIVREVLELRPGRFPAERIHPVHGELRWFLDRDAASQLTRVPEP